MNIYIDLGCNDGKTVEEFRNWAKLAFPDQKDWVIYAFDPNPKFLDKWEGIENEGTHFSQAAAWTHDGQIEFAVEQTEESLGSTIMPGKKKVWDSSPKMNVDCFDFSKFLLQFKEDYVVVKIDAEGAEFPVLEKLIKDNTHVIIDVLMVEFHPNKVVEYTTDDKNSLIERLSKDIKVLEWH